MKLREDLNGLDQEQRNKILEVARLLETEKSASGDCPTWYNATNSSIDEVDYCTWFMAKHPLKYVGGIFYDIDGLESEEKLKKEKISALKKSKVSSNSQIYRFYTHYSLDLKK